MDAIEFGSLSNAAGQRLCDPSSVGSKAAAVGLSIDELHGQSSLVVLNAIALLTPRLEQSGQSLSEYIEQACKQLLNNALGSKSHLGSKELSAVLPAAKNADRLGCLHAVAELALALLQTPSSHRKGDEFYFAAVVEMYIDRLRQQSPMEAEALELEVLRTIPNFDCHRSAPWAPHRPGVTKNTREFATLALQHLQGQQRVKFLDICDFDWLGINDVKTTLLNRPLPERGSRFSRCTKEVACELYLHIEQQGRLLAQYQPCLAQMPGWRAFLEDETLLLPLFQCDPLKETSGSGTAVWTSLLALSTQCKAPLRARLMEEMVTYTTMAYLVKSRACGFLCRDTSGLCSVLWHAVRHGASVQRIREQLLGMRILSSPRLNAEAVPLIQDRGETDASISDLVAYDIPVETVNQFRSAMVESGILSVGSVRNLPFDADIVAASLRASPARLAEVSSLDLFVELAKQFNIPVRIPEYEVAVVAPAADYVESAVAPADAGEANEWESTTGHPPTACFTAAGPASDFDGLDLSALDAADKLNGVRRNHKAQLRT